MDSASIAIAAVAGTAAAAYLDARYNIGKDLGILKLVKETENAAVKAAQEKRQSLFYVWEETANKFPTARSIWSRDGNFTYAESYYRVLQLANWMLHIGIKPKDSVGLYSSNSPDFIHVVLATWAIGAFPAMINYNLADASLVHCVKVAKAKILLVENDRDLVTRVEGSGKQFEELGIQPVVLSEQVKRQVSTFPDTRPPDSYRDHMVGFFPCCLIYTSGTTGLPKAFPYPSARMFTDSMRFYKAVQLQGEDPDRDVWYDCMPLYHGTGFVTGMNGLIRGITLAIGKKFSVSQFWRDVHDSQATCFVYVGETARYLLAAPPSKLDRGHKLRLMYGNGMRPDVWDRFQKRFEVPEILEFFTSTEGMFSVNIWSRSGFGAKTVGHHGLLLRLLMHSVYVPVALDPVTNDMYRDPATGFARRVPYEQGGEVIVKIENRDLWPGYYNNKDGTNKKFIADVFQKGDLYYRPGDALRRDGDGFWFFLDRLGDTFRWKGENVSTAEVQEVMGLFPTLGEANVYGVEVPGSEGRAGCAAVVLEGNKPAKDFDWTGLTTFLREKLPRYAVPVFIRVIDADAQAMGTHNNKQNKVLLRAEGADPKNTGVKVPHGDKDVLYWLRPGKDRYEPFGQGDWDSIVAGKSKL